MSEYLFQFDEEADYFPPVDAVLDDLSQRLHDGKSWSYYITDKHWLNLAEI
jgi:hypothetical protein